jgi:cell division protease FtsH
MDGFDNKTSIVVIAATNRPDILDSALTRAGRFDRKVLVSRPTYDERLAIFNYYLTDRKVSKDLDVESLARRTS